MIQRAAPEVHLSLFGATNNCVLMRPEMIFEQHFLSDLLLDASQLLQDTQSMLREEHSFCSSTQSSESEGGIRVRTNKLETPPARPLLPAWLPLARLVWKWHIKQLRFTRHHNKHPGTGTSHSQEVTRRFGPRCFGTCPCTQVCARDIFALTPFKVSQDYAKKTHRISRNCSPCSDRAAWSATRKSETSAQGVWTTPPISEPVSKVQPGCNQAGRDPKCKTPPLVNQWTGREGFINI